MNIPTRTVLTTAIAVLARTAFAANPAPPHPATETKPEQPAGKYELKKHSSFTLATQTRAPFWQIGWVPKHESAPAEVTKAPKAQVDPAAFVVTSVLLGNPSLALINGRSYGEGEFVRMPKGSAPAKVRVMAIGDGTVTLQCEGKNFAVEIHRPELAEHKAEPDLLDQDR